MARRKQLFRDGVAKLKIEVPVLSSTDERYHPVQRSLTNFRVDIRLNHPALKAGLAALTGGVQTLGVEGMGAARRPPWTKEDAVRWLLQQIGEQVLELERSETRSEQVL